MQQQDMDLARRCRELSENSRSAGAWLQDNAELVGSERAALQKDLRHAARFFDKCEQAALRKMCVGVFGPSQSGKSYLISTLASNTDKVLLTDFCGQTFDFIKDINPVGGKESTGLVTRFTTTPPEGVTEAYPIRLRLLSETDVARVLANTYYADCDHKDAPNAEALAKELERLEGRAKAGPVAGGLTVDDVEELRDYVNKNFISRPRVQMFQNGFWVRAMELAPRLELEDRASLISLIWDDVPEFKAVYLQLGAALQQLGNPTEATCGIDALIPRNNSIIDVELLKGLNNPSTDLLTVVGTGGRKADLPRALVTALTAEITIHMLEKPDDFFDHTDLLDFPGYRARYKIGDLRAKLGEEDMLKQLFLRGKVAYLFERYREEKELTSMLLCIGPSTQEVQDLPQAVYEWICSTHGEKPEMRAGKAPALFFVLTKMDMEFEKKAGSTLDENRWSIRLESSLLKFFGQLHDWPQNWDGTHPFNNVFLLRNPNFLCEAIFDYNGRTETGIRQDQQAFVAQVRQAFLSSEMVQKHVGNPEEAWQAAMTLNDGGVGLLRKRLSPLCNPDLKRQQINGSLAEKCDRIQTGLTPFYRTDDREELRKQKEQLSRLLVSLMAKVAERQMFGEFLRRLQVRDFDLYEICLNARQSQGDGQNGNTVQVVGARVLANDILDDIFGGDAPAAPPVNDTVQDEQTMDNAQVFAGLVMDHWTGRLHDLCNDAEARNLLGLPARELDQFCHELAQAAARCKLRDTLEDELRRCSAFSNITRERLMWKQVSLAADAINAFVDWWSFDPRFKDQPQRTVVFGGKSVSLFNPPPEIEGEPSIGEVESPYDRMWYTDWLRAMAYSVMANVDFDGQQSLNPEQNSRLREILQAFKG